MSAKVKYIGSTLPQWTFADRIRKVRRDTGRTIEQMAVALEIGDKRYAAWETGRNRPDDIAAVAVKLENVTGVPRQWFLGWVSEEEPATPVGPAGIEPTTSTVELRRFANRRHLAQHKERLRPWPVRGTQNERLAPVISLTSPAS